MFPSPKTIKLIFLYSFFCVFHDLVHAETPYHSCSNTTISSNQFKYNPFDNLLRFLSSNASVSKSYKTSIRSGRETLHGLFLCYNYVPKSECQRCIAKAASDIQSLCPNANDAIVWEEECQLRCSNERFFGKLDVARNRIWQNSYNVSESDVRIIVKDLLHNLTKKAAFNASTGMYATEKTNFTRPDIEAIYALVQCTADLSADDCNTCLVTAILNVPSGRNFPRGARILSPSCYLRYEFYDFYMQSQPTQNQSEMPKRKRSRRDKWMIVVLSTGSAILLVLGFCVYHIALRNRTKTRAGNIYSRDVQLFDMGDPNNEDFMHQNLHGRDNLNHQEFPFFNLETLNQATNNFSDSNKLGQGGFGPVYKGTLPDGVEVAVKRLSINSEQGLDEFTNEVLLILKLQHKNLVKLLGFCVDREEKLLVYEYMPNGSLDVILFDPSKRVQLNWSRRLNIINGIVRGMLYLHEDSRLRIIHRDLKVSNVLLDKDMNSKISDFGMARIFKGSDGEANTAKIVGTFGYMAPEFAMEGLYSIKSDVFSFGVLLLEIITGRRNIGFHLSKRAPSLLAYTWQLWNEGKGLELIDPLLLDSCCFDEFLRYMHIGLLCVQEDAYDRPTMSSVMVMLKSKAVTLRQPERPAFSVGRFIDQCEVNENSFFPQ